MNLVIFYDIDLRENISYTHIYLVNIIYFLLYSILWDLQTVMKIRLTAFKNEEIHEYVFFGGKFY